MSPDFSEIVRFLLILQIFFGLPWLLAGILRSTRERTPASKVTAGKIVFSQQNGRNMQIGLFEQLPSGNEIMATYFFPAFAPGLVKDAFAKLCVHNDTCYAYNVGDGIVRNPDSMRSIMRLNSRLVVVPLASIPGTLIAAILFGLSVLRSFGGIAAAWLVFLLFFNVICLAVYESIVKNEQSRLDEMTMNLEISESEKPKESEEFSKNDGIPA
jgi:hypothetical protein